MSQQQVKPIVLAISGLDPSGGAGISADIEAILSCGARCAPVISTLTIQDTHSVTDTIPVALDIIRQQINSILADLPIGAIKLGLLGAVELVEMLAELLANYPNIPVVLDPVLASGSGQPFAADDYAIALRDKLAAACTLITPNQQEALRLAQRASLEAALDTLLATGVHALLLTGTDVDTQDVINTLYQNDAPPVDYFWPRLPDQYHGSGCTLAAACAAFIARGCNIREAVTAAQSFTWQALQAGVQYSDGQYLPDRGFDIIGDT